ncbi:MAG: hypothetical protein JO179_21855, partial [Solirubrobacterales bacterium]|nr:hypothetical protein [Solirubrobacterales bacterium]
MARSLGRWICRGRYRAGESGGLAALRYDVVPVTPAATAGRTLPETSDAPDVPRPEPEPEPEPAPDPLGGASLPASPPPLPGPPAEWPVPPLDAPESVGACDPLPLSDEEDPPLPPGDPEPEPEPRPSPPAAEPEPVPGAPMLLGPEPLPSEPAPPP